MSIVLLSACTDEQAERKLQKQAVLNSMKQDYLEQIEELGIAELNEETKWRLYCNHCDVPVKDCNGQTLNGVTYGMLDLQVFFLKYENGKGELAYTFTRNGATQCTLDSVAGNKVHGIGFEKEGKAPLYYISSGSNKHIATDCDMQDDVSDCPTRMINPDQPVIRKFLATHREKLNPWFHMQAVKRGFLD